jgi:hypothetical protein
MSVSHPRRTAEEPGQAGQGLVEFALLIPILTVLVMGLLEVALLFNAYIGVNRVSQGAGHLASILGNTAGADCLILEQIEDDIYVPNDPRRIQEVIIERTALAGNVSYQQQVWTRTGTTDCALPDGTTTPVPYTLQPPGALPAYPEDQRCTVLKGCPAMIPARSTVDNIGVRVRYRHEWLTPLNSIYGFFAGGDTGWTFTQRNIFRIEPTL